MIAKTCGVGLWCDTSENLILSQYQFLANAGYRGCIRYVPLSGQSTSAYGVIQLGELQAALSVKCPDGTPFGIMFVQFARTSDISATTGQADGAASVNYLKSLDVPNTVCLWQDLSGSVASNDIVYSNASYSSSITTGWAASAVGCYCEPGYPLTASQRYTELNVPRYWATAANDPQKMVTPRGCQIIQAWGSSNGEFFPEPGLVIDADLVQSDYFGNFPVCVVAA